MMSIVLVLTIITPTVYGVSALRLESNFIRVAPYVIKWFTLFIMEMEIIGTTYNYYILKHIQF